MKTNLYSVSVPLFKKHLLALSALLDKAAEFAAGDEAKLQHLLTDKLYDDMFPFNRQIEIASDNAKGFVGRLTDKETPKFEDNKETFGELKERIANTVAFLDTVSESDFEGAEERSVTLPFMSEKTLTGFGYATEFAIPNFFFHVVTAYALLRKNGVPIGKTDYITSLPFQEAA